MRYASILLVVAFLAGPVAAQETPALIAQIKAVGKEGKGNAAAAKAWKQLTESGPAALFDTLAALHDADPVATNWLRSAVDAIAERALQSKSLPADRLEAFVRDVKQRGDARRLAYDWLTRADATAPKRLLPGMLDDPSSGLRRDAVAVLLDQAEEQLKATNKAGATATYQKALTHAHDADQVKKAAGALEKLGVDVDLVRQFGFITQWRLVGPFDNVKGVGFKTPYPPEKGFDAAATFESKDGKKIGWQEHVTDMAMGTVDLNKVYGRLKGAIVYAHTTVDSAGAQPVEIRVGSFNAVRMYLNGKEIYFREEYHHGMDMDQHIGKGMLKAGKNEILLKVCQNEQTESWAQSWIFQLRVCDALGGPAPITVGGIKK